MRRLCLFLATSMFGCMLDVPSLPEPPSAIPGVLPYASELRCRELGQACICSEPLNLTQPIACNGQLCYLDPLDSEGPDARECGSVEGAVYIPRSTAEPTIDVEAVTVDPAIEGVPLPSGSPVRQVWLHYAGSGSLQGSPFEMSNTTVCVRSYQRWHPALPPPPAPDTELRVCTNMQVVTSSGHIDLQTAYDNPTGDRGYTLTVVSDGLDKAVGGNADPRTISFNDCKSSWCRFELCIDHDGQFMAARARVTQLSSGVSETFGPIGPSTTPTANWGSTSLSLVDFFCNYKNPSDESRRYFSHAMQAMVEPHDPQWWLGPAAEIEPH